MDRALNGVEQPIFAYGKHVGTRRVINDRLLMFLLRNRVPERFAEGGRRAPNAGDRQRLAVLKADWHAEWKAEQRRSSEAARKSVLAELEQMAERLVPDYNPFDEEFIRALAPEEAKEGEEDR